MDLFSEIELQSNLAANDADGINNNVAEQQVGSLSSLGGEDLLSFSPEETSKFAVPLQFAIVGKFSHGFPSLKHIHKYLHSLGLGGDFSIHPLNLKHILIILSCDADFSRLWLKREWLIEGFPMRTFKWTPDFNPSLESPLAPVWVRFPALPPHLFDRDALFAVARLVGSPLLLDGPTAGWASLELARVLVEIDISAPRVESVKIKIGEDVIVQKVNYEYIPKYCSFCKHIGHDLGGCYQNGNAPKPATRQFFKTKVAGDKKKGKGIMPEKMKECPGTQLQPLDNNNSFEALNVAALSEFVNNPQSSENVVPISHYTNEPINDVGYKKQSTIEIGVGNGENVAPISHYNSEPSNDVPKASVVYKKQNTEIGVGICEGPSFQHSRDFPVDIDDKDFGLEALFRMPVERKHDKRCLEFSSDDLQLIHSHKESDAKQ
ncbi:hypothetical protein BUALT_Bualt05G0012600 [Buddleja alternifolia]|uniref:DUF4283 domain-containing protein n=1 Tax=Buddleja alternifolia TaxID=168488 RepID=A0AAV6XRI2_9LAMI|nr:hypothetical protein BUALT_Bualt05G0012600 [Buddleja alternifolia]